jgi:uncharacterized Tic20 family protein
MEQIAPYTPTQDEKMTAMLAHLLPIFVPILGPLVIYFSRRGSRFVAFHALQAALLQCVLIVGGFALFICWFVFLMILTHGMSEWSIRGMAFAMFIWVAFQMAMMGVYALYASKAIVGKWSEYPLVGLWARRWVGIAPQQPQKPSADSGPQSAA